MQNTSQPQPEQQPQETSTTGFQAACAAKAREILDDDQSENTEYTLHDFLEQNPDELLNDGGTTWRADNLLAALDLEGDPILDHAVHVDETGVFFFDARGYMISPPAYRFERPAS